LIIFKGGVMKKLMRVVGVMMITLSLASINWLVAEDGAENIDEPQVVEQGPDSPNPPVGFGPGNQMPSKMKKPGIGPERMGMKKGPMMEEFVEPKVLEVIKNNDASLYQKTMALKEKDPAKYNEFIKVSFGVLNMGRNLEDKTIEKDIVRGISLEWEVRELGLKYDKAQDSEKAKIKEEMKAKLNEIFDIRTKVQELRVKKMESDLKELKANIEKRKANKQDIVNQRLNQITGKKYLNW